MDESKITKAVEFCLALAIGTNHPFGRVEKYLNGLKTDPQWTGPEISEVQLRIIRELMIRLETTD